MSAAPVEPAVEQGVEPPAERLDRPRIAPKKGLRAMSIFVTDLVLAAKKGANGEFADRTFIEITPEIAEALDDVAATLDYFYINRQIEKAAEERKKNWGRR